jgi:hypothetical protein
MDDLGYTAKHSMFDLADTSDIVLGDNGFHKSIEHAVQFSVLI